ncbi:MAG: hypothetical protein DCC65_11945 [Planctomycetota bacterium]|nr:MAG: hypothetical protein DCC65_11945 [Planctomycetota bacterium]
MHSGEIFAIESTMTDTLVNPLQLVRLTETRLEDGTLLSFPVLAGVPGFAHAVTTRPWNMAPHRGPHADLAVLRRRKICEHLGLPFDRLTAPDQIHSPHVLRIEPGDVGAGRDGRHTAIKFADGLICDLPGVPVIQFSADCPLVLVIDPERRVFGTAHSSWRGTVTHIVVEMIDRLRSEFGVEPARCLAAICPCAGPNRYEVGDDVRRIALSRLKDGARYFRPHTSGKWFFDMRAANAAQLVACGVSSERIHVADHCTMSDDRFYSHRRDGADTGRFALVAGFHAS